MSLTRWEDTVSISFMKHGLAALAVGALLTAGCGDSDSDTVAEESVPEAPAVELPVSVETTTDIAYTSERSLDIYAPTEGSDWPVVVYFHGGPPAPGARTDPETLTAIAEQGVVVYAPDWRSLGPAGGSEDSICAVAYAEATAADHGGDARAVTLSGYSTGGYTALIHGFMGDDPPLPVTDCLVDPVMRPPAAVAAGGTPLFAPEWARDGKLPVPAWTELTPEQVDQFDPELVLGKNPTMVVNLFVGDDDQGGLVAPPGGWPITDVNREYLPKLVEAGYAAELIVVPGGHELSPEGLESFTTMIVETATAAAG
ncbi:MAG TPA: alpha/beta fold hydrolase [Acidimicrobiales bacterium]|nr:alpha/beta fold hydrolase [Acidimicrobiales bacterium]